jgi:hypothetical protein
MYFDGIVESMHIECGAAPRATISVGNVQWTYLDTYIHMIHRYSAYGKIGKDTRDSGTYTYV